MFCQVQELECSTLLLIWLKIGGRHIWKCVSSHKQAKWLATSNKGAKTRFNNKIAAIKSNGLDRHFKKVRPPQHSQDLRGLYFLGQLLYSN